jgi:hypothetical protein
MRTNTQASPALAVRRGKVSRPQKVVVYGPEGVGKSSLAAQMPQAVFLDTEGGTHHLDVARFDTASTWEDITGAVAQLGSSDHPFRTLVIDTVDWLEKRLAEYLCRKAGKESIEDFGYGKGWVLLAEEFARFLGSLERLVARGMHVVFLAHATVKKFEAPDQVGSYDRFELKLSKQVAPLIKEWADVVLFATYVTRTVEKEGGKLRGVGGKERVLYANHAAAFDAKNRHGLADKLSFGIESLAPVFGPVAEPVLSADAKLPSIAERIAAAFAAKADMADLSDFLVARGQLHFTEEGSVQSLDHLDAAYAQRMLAEPDRFLAAMAEWVQSRSQEVVA